MIHQTVVVVGAGIPWAIDLELTCRLTGIGVAKGCGDAAARLRTPRSD
jgi:hypothetical protein